MTNTERSEYYFGQADEEYKQLQYYYEKKNWNMTIRKAQEVIELLLKGALKHMNIEFPKEHDIGEYFEKILIKRKINYNKEIMLKIILASKELAEKRAPAYYGEEFYSQEEAKTAKEQAEITKIFITDLMKKLEKDKNCI